MFLAYYYISTKNKMTNKIKINYSKKGYLFYFN